MMTHLIVIYFERSHRKSFGFLCWSIMHDAPDGTSRAGLPVLLDCLLAVCIIVGQLPPSLDGSYSKDQGKAFLGDQLLFSSDHPQIACGIFSPPWHGPKTRSPIMSSIIRSSSSSRQSASTTSLDEIPGADPLSASKGHHRTRSGRRFGTSIVNTPSKSAKKNKEGGGGVGAGGASTTKKKSTAKKNRSASRLLSRASSTKKRSSAQQQQHLSASLPAADLSYDFASISLSQSFGSGTNLRSTSVGFGASSSSESRDDYEDAVAMRRLPSAITADYSAKMSGTAASISSASSNFVNAASIFRSKKNTNKTGSEMTSTIPAIQRSNPIFDTDRHYTINFESDDDSEERVSTTTELGNYIIRHAEQQQQKKEETEDGANSIDSIFRMVDKVLDTTDAAMSWMCLQRANPIIDSDDEDAALQHHDLHLKEETSCYQPECMWSKRKDAVAEEKNVMVLEMGNQLTDEVNGYKIPMPR